MSTLFKSVCWLALLLAPVAVRAQESGVPEHHDEAAHAGEEPEDVLIFKDGDRLTGQMIRAERGSVVFRTGKLGEVNVSFGEIRDLICVNRFAVLRQGVRVTRPNAIIGRIELKDDEVVIVPDNGSPITLAGHDVALAIDDVTFEREVLRKTNIHEGWSATASLGASMVHSTEDGISLNTDLYLTRTLPGVDYLPRRNRTYIAVRDSFELIKRPDLYGNGPSEDETHIFHAEAERNEYVREHFYLLGNYSFDRNFAQGLNAQNVFGLGMGWTVVNNYVQQLDLKTDVNRNAQRFTDPSNDDVLFGEKFVVEYRRQLPGNLSIQTTTDYLASYNLPHKYSANGTAVLTLPIYKSIGISLTTTDNYLNNPTSGSKRNTYRFSTNLTYSFR